MPVIPHSLLSEIVTKIYEAKAVPPDEAAIVARHQVESNLTGHDSHGVTLLPLYLESIDKGHLIPGATLHIEDETPSTLVVDGNWGFGFVVTERVVNLMAKKAAHSGVCVACVKHQGHVGRLGGYTAILANEGCIGIMTADSGAGPKAVAPFGGSDRRLGTNPLSIAIPWNGPGHLLLDMATSAVAGGKVRLAQLRHESIPYGWVVDRDGQPTTDPGALFAGGAQLPLGGDQGHKGFGLSLMVEVLSGLLTGIGFGAGPADRINDGCFLVAIRVANFRDLDAFKRDVNAFIAFIKASPVASGFSEILYPGEIEYRYETARRAKGIPLDDGSWQRILEIMESLRLAVPSLQDL